MGVAFIFTPRSTYSEPGYGCWVSPELEKRLAGLRTTVMSPAAPETSLVMATSGKPPLTRLAEIIAVGVEPEGPAGGSKAEVKNPAVTPRNTRKVFAPPLVTAISAWPS